MSLPPPVANHVIEIVAEALYRMRWRESEGTWPEFKAKKPDIAAIYLENAKVAISAYQRAA